MADWTGGYVTEVDYTHGYFRELNPARVALTFSHAGLVHPEVGMACELGFGQGISINIHAAASKVAWYGTDFNPSQAGFAMRLAGASAAGTALCDEAFADYAQRKDLPDFDFIGLHGIWSWISDENRVVIVDFIRRKLKVGGVLYISYNTMPGWAPVVPVRDLLIEYADAMLAPAVGSINRMEAALGFAEKLMATNPAFVRANPKIPKFLESLKSKDRNYLVHEYFNRNWLPMSFSRMANWLSEAKLSYACSANYLDGVDSVNLLSDQQDFLNKIPDALFREGMRDYMVNQNFRRDYWVKGPRRLKPGEQVGALRRQKVILTTHRQDVPLKVKGAQGEAALNELINNPILDLLSDHKPRTLDEIEQVVSGKGIAFNQVVQSVMTLIGADQLTVAQDESIVAIAKNHTDKLNDHFLRMALCGHHVDHLASPVTGEGVALGRTTQLFLLAANQGEMQPAEWAQFVWQTLAAQGQKLIKEGKTLETPEANLAELTAQAQTFAEKQLPILKALQIA
ncbi:class I SAM-dependent methyltransferase [Thauera aromatica]|uniref:class I SAM-dependent methyltransferase n=1 Tax=Thauera aromatica TaxID=59405 RepID=UPI001FFCE854|nr:methyltransferase regulatory domain-containing protein [Thauera aromatica]MCK2097393.1 methyltransferase regulatory domain-containing protein [Thauera aromatica]